MMGKYQKLIERVKTYLEKERAKKGIWSRLLSDKVFDSEYWLWRKHGVCVGIGWGACFSIAPLPMQSLWAIVASMWKKGNVPLSVLCCWLSPPGFTFFSAPLQWLLGNWIFQCFSCDSGVSYAVIREIIVGWEWQRFLDLVSQTRFSVALGEFVVGVVISCGVFGVVGYWGARGIWELCDFFRHKNR